MAAEHHEERFGNLCALVLWFVRRKAMHETTFFREYRGFAREISRDLGAHGAIDDRKTRPQAVHGR